MIRALLKNHPKNDFFVWFGTIPNVKISVDEKKLFTKSHTSNLEAYTSKDQQSQVEGTHKES